MKKEGIYLKRNISRFFLLTSFKTIYVGEYSDFSEFKTNTASMDHSESG